MVPVSASQGGMPTSVSAHSTVRQVERRAADDLSVGGSGLLLQGFPQFAGSSLRVLDGDHRLGVKFSDQLDLGCR